MDYSRPEFADALAAEYVSGALRGGARRRFESLLPAHAALRGAVHGWQARLMPLTSVVVPVQPSPLVWKRIEARIQGGAPAPQASVGWWRQLAFWRSLSAVAGVAALSLGVMLASPGPVQPPIVIVLSAAAPAPGSAAGSVLPASFVTGTRADGSPNVSHAWARTVDGAQGGDLDAILDAGLDSGRAGLLINSARHIIFAGGGLPEAIRKAAVELHTAINRKRFA